MAYIGCDWRGPGHIWIQSGDGWIKASSIGHPLNVTLTQSSDGNESLPGNQYVNHVPHNVQRSGHQPHVFVRRNIQFSMSDSFKKLAMADAARDVPRFEYVRKVVEILLKTQLADLSGTTQRVLFGILSHLVSHAMETETNLNEAKQLINDASLALELGTRYNHYGGKVWNDNIAAVEDLKNTLDCFQLSAREDDGNLTLSDLPDECLLGIMSAFTDYKDILNLGACDPQFSSLSHDWKHWRNLCLFHFSSKQIESMGARVENLDDYSAEDIILLHTRLLKKFGAKETYGETLDLCHNCSALYWGRSGHPCLVVDATPSSVPISPSECLKFFSG